MNENRIETLKSAVEAIESCRKAGKVTLEGIKAVAAAISLGIRPPVVLTGRQPLVCKDVRAVPGSWPHFAQALCNAEVQKLDMAKLEAAVKTGDETAKKRLGFLQYVLNAVHGALLSSLRQSVAQKEEAEAVAKRQAANAKAEADRRAREAADAKRRAEREARKAEQKAAHDAILAAAHGATAAPETVQPGQRDRHPRLTLERVRILLDKESRKRGEEQDVDPSEAKLLAARFVFGLVLKTEAEGKHTPEEIAVMKAEVKALVATVRLPACKNLAEAQREADAWAARAESFARRQNAAPQPAPAPAEGSVPARQPRPERRGQPKPAPDGHIQGANVMEIAMAKAGLVGKAANG